MYTPTSTDYTRTVIAERLRQAEAARLVRRARRTPADAAEPNRLTSVVETGRRLTWPPRWIRRDRLQAAS